jgi:hypothetical protein
MKARAGIASVLAACAAAGALLIAGCGMFDRVADGGTIETTNGIAARVVLPSGQPASNIKVFLLDEQDWLEKTKAGESIVIDSAETDTAGRFKFEDVDTTRASSLYADVENYGLLIHNVTQEMLNDDYDSTLGMSKKVSYQGTIKDTTFVAEKIYLAGTPFQADIDSTGKFVIKNVPQEYYSVIILRRLPDASKEYVVSEKVKLDEWTEGKPTVITPDTTKALLIEDFEDLDNRNLPGPILGGGWWDAINDYPSNNTMLSQPANTAPQNFLKAIKDGGGERAHSLQVLYKLRETAPAGTIPMVVLTSNLGAQNVHYNLSGMDSLSFYSGGSGKLTVELVQENPAGSGVALSVIAKKTFVLGPIWERLTVKPSDLAVSVDYFPANPAEDKAALEEARLPAYTKKPTTWEEMGGMVTQIRFRGTEGAEFWLDHIRIHGITAGDLVK